MRGNHESPVEFPFSSHDLPFDISERFEYEKGKRIYNTVLDLFRQLSLVTLVKSRLLIVHGGLPTELDRFSGKVNYKSLLSQAQENHMKNRIMEEILWNDPREFIPNNRDWEESRRGYGRHFGMNITRKWLGISDTRVIIRGHEPCQGFRINHNGTVLTLFSCHEAYPSFQAAYIKIPSDSLIKLRSAQDLVEHVSML